jgi:hypothetical protein
MGSTDLPQLRNPHSELRISGSKNIQPVAVEVWTAQSLALQNLVLRLLRLLRPTNTNMAARTF